MSFSRRKGNLAKRSFPYNNLGYGNSLAIPLAVNQKVGGLSSPRDATNLSWDEWGLGTPQSVSTKSLSAPKGPEVLVVGTPFF